MRHLFYQKSAVQKLVRRCGIELSGRRTNPAGLQYFCYITADFLRPVRSGRFYRQVALLVPGRSTSTRHYQLNGDGLTPEEEDDRLTRGTDSKDLALHPFALWLLSTIWDRSIGLKFPFRFEIPWSS
eukprot:963259-Rhodomonas_salina.3